MSQNWHAHWVEDGFKPTRLQNWEVPKWYPEWPVRHCINTKFEAHKNGRIFADAKKRNAGRNPWTNFKGTWELPLKIDRHTAEELSKSYEYKKKSWNAHFQTHQEKCKRICRDSIPIHGKIITNRTDKEKEAQDILTAQKHQEANQTLKIDMQPKDLCKIVNKCKL